MPHLSAIMPNLSFCNWLISFSILSSRFIHAVACGSISFLSESVSRCVYGPQFLSPFIWGWTLRMFPHLHLCGYCCGERRSTTIWDPDLTSFGWVPRRRRWIRWQLYFRLSEGPHSLLHSSCTDLHSHPRGTKAQFWGQSSVPGAGAMIVEQG